MEDKTGTGSAPQDEPLTEARIRDVFEVLELATEEQRRAFAGPQPAAGSAVYITRVSNVTTRKSPPAV